MARLPLPEYLRVEANARTHGFDFDDSHQHTAPEKYGLPLVRFDHHSDSTPLGRRPPDQILNAP